MFAQDYSNNFESATEFKVENEFYLHFTVFKRIAKDATLYIADSLMTSFKQYAELSSTFYF